MELVMGKTFGESIGKVILSRDMGEFNGVVEHFLPEIVVSHVDVFGAIMSNRILGELNGGIVVVENGKGTRDRVSERFKRVRSQTACRVASAEAMYSASAVERAVVGCRRDFQATGPPKARKRYPVVDRRVSRHPPQSASA
jgi:hypothetical protein